MNKRNTLGIGIGIGTAGLVVTTFALAAIAVACTTTTTTTTPPPPAESASTDKQPTEPPPDGGSKTDNDDTPGSSSSSSSSSSGGAAGVCASSATQQACVQCCAKKFEQGAAVYMGALTECLCAADKCKDDCPTTLCADTPSNPDAKCNACVSSKSQTCSGAVSAACGASPECVQFNNCADQSKCASKN